MSLPILVNGRPQAWIDPRDRGLQYGDGLFETIAVHDRRLALWDFHLCRLMQGCERLGIRAPDADTLAREVRSVGPEHGRAVVKVIVTRGVGGRGYRPSLDPVPATRVVSAHPWPDYPADNAEHGVRVRLCRTRLGWNAALAGLKHLNRLEQVMARREWHDPDIAEGLMLDQAEHVVEGTMSNLFLVRDGRLITPTLERCGVAGVRRRAVLACAAALGLAVAEQAVALADLTAADELFLTNSIIGLWPVRHLDGRSYPVGPLTRALAAELARSEVLT